MEYGYILTGMEDIFTHLLSAHTVQKFKCHPAVYQMGPDSLGTPLGDILFVSSNCWDVAGATWYGYNTFWVNRYIYICIYMCICIRVNMYIYMYIYLCLYTSGWKLHMI
jgi:hypothetical protein